MLLVHIKYILIKNLSFCLIIFNKNSYPSIHLNFVRYFFSNIYHSIGKPLTVCPKTILQISFSFVVFSSGLWVVMTKELMSRLNCFFHHIIFCIVLTNLFRIVNFLKSKWPTSGLVHMCDDAYSFSHPQCSRGIFIGSTFWLFRIFSYELLETSNSIPFPRGKFRDLSTSMSCPHVMP